MILTRTAYALYTLLYAVFKTIYIMGLTKAQKHNKMLNETFDYYNQHQKSLPSCHLYKRFLEISEEKLNITKEQARNKYGLYTVAEWEKLLKLGWNS